MATQNLLELPPELLDQILGNFCPEGRAWSIRRGPGGGAVHVPMEALKWNSWAGKSRAIIGDWNLPSILALGVGSHACRLAATRDSVWRERAEILDRTYFAGPQNHWQLPAVDALVPVPQKAWYCSDSEDEDERAAMPAPVPLPEEYVDPRRLDPGFAAKSPFQRYLSLAKFRNRVRVKLESLCDEGSWSEADRKKLQGLCDLAKESIEFASDEGWYDGDLPQPVGYYYQKCTLENAAKEVVQFALRGLDQGVNDNGFLRNAAGRLIVYGFAHGIYPGFPGSREFEWEYAPSGLEALNPDNF